MLFRSTHDAHRATEPRGGTGAERRRDGRRGIRDVLADDRGPPPGGDRRGGDLERAAHESVGPRPRERGSHLFEQPRLEGEAHQLGADREEPAEE